MNIVVLGAHCDDPESGCGGLAAFAVRQGHRVCFAYGSSGGPGRTIDGRPEDQVREPEATAACRVLGAEPYFLHFPNSDIPFTQAAVKRVSDLVRELDADLVITHWPADTHPDHQAIGALGTQVVVGNPDVALAYYEVCPGIQTFAFEPNCYVDITDVVGPKLEACRCHVSQGVEGWWKFHETTDKMRYVQLNGATGRDDGQAEGYYLAVATPAAQELFVTRSRLWPSGSRNVRKTRHEDVPLV